MLSTLIPRGVTEQKMVVQPALADSQTLAAESCSGGIWAILSKRAATQGNGKLILKSPNSPMACTLQILYGKITSHCGLGVEDHDGS